MNTLQRIGDVSVLYWGVGMMTMLGSLFFSVMTF